MRRLAGGEALARAGVDAYGAERDLDVLVVGQRDLRRRLGRDPVLRRIRALQDRVRPRRGGGRDEEDPRERRYDAEPRQARCSHVRVTIRPRRPDAPCSPDRVRPARAGAWERSRRSVGARGVRQRGRVRPSIVIRIAAVGAAAAVLLGLGAGPASAHTISGPRPTNYRSHIVAMAPVEPGITARVVDLGNKFELTNRSSTEITVLGYEGEPYLRIGPDGIFENLHSQATYINRTRLGGTVPAGIDTSPTARPSGRRSRAVRLRAGTTIASTGWARSRRRPSRNRPAPCTASRNRASCSSATAGPFASWSRSIGFPVRAGSRGSPCSPCCSSPVCSPRCCRDGGACSRCSSACSWCPTSRTRSRTEIPRPGGNLVEVRCSSSAAASSRSRCGSPRSRRSS